MTRTETDIRDALDVEPDLDAVARLTAFAEAFDDSPGQARAAAPRSRVRRLAPLLAAVVVAALATTAAALLAPGAHRDESGSGPYLGPFPSAAALRPTWDLAVGHVAGYTSARLSTDTFSEYPNSTYAAVTATSSARPERGDIQTCHVALSSCYKELTTPQRITVAGHRGRWYPGRHASDQDGLIAKDYNRPWTAAYEEHDYWPLLVWQVDARTSVSITGTFGFDPATYDYDNVAAKKIMLRLAAAVKTGRRDDVHMPFTLRDLPSHLAPEAVFLGRGNHCIGYGNGRQSDEREWVGSVITACRVVTRHSRAATIKAADGITPSETAGVSVHDFPDGTSMVLEVDSSQRRWVSTDQRRRLASGADVSPRLSDPSTWLVVR